MLCACEKRRGGPSRATPPDLHTALLLRDRYGPVALTSHTAAHAHTVNPASSSPRGRERDTRAPVVRVFSQKAGQLPAALWGAIADATLLPHSPANAAPPTLFPPSSSIYPPCARPGSQANPAIPPQRPVPLINMLFRVRVFFCFAFAPREFGAADRPPRKNAATSRCRQASLSACPLPTYKGCVYLLDGNSSQWTARLPRRPAESCRQSRAAESSPPRSPRACLSQKELTPLSPHTTTQATFALAALAAATGTLPGVQAR